MIRYLENMEREIIISNSLSEIAKITQFIEELSLSLQLSSCVTMSINLAIEEAVINIINHAYPTNEKGEIVLRVKAGTQVLTFLIIDDGISFDPIQTENSDVAMSLEQRLTEGLRFCLIRRTMDEVSYHTIGTLNHLTLMKKIDVLPRPEATMKTNLCKIEDVTILAIEGRLDTINANGFNAVIQPLLADTAPNIIINCEGMTYISSSGLRSFIMLQKSVSQHKGCLAVEAVQPEIRKIFDMTGCSSLFTIR
ncbi:anti-sigma factor antagonist [Bacteroides sp.]|uniref:anti-sigma factor antagonist n=1 Tax=Bacteroides sp. TaxID=29523 RepID=UPI0025BFBE0B|nr:anti-sigma factor antagonist [Bacteroides sp.]